MQTIRCGEPLHYVGIAVAVSTGVSRCFSSYIFDFTVYAKSELKKTSILSAIREE